MSPGRDGPPGQSPNSCQDRRSPHRTRDVAKATGRLAKTDTLDARGPAPRPLPEAQAHALRALLTRRRHLGPRLTAERLQSTPGGGPLRLRTLVAAVPEVGALNRQEIAALLGVAPLNRDRGTVRGKRAVWGGRAHVRAVLSRSTLAAGRHHSVRTAFDERLRAVGKAPKVALTACMRKLLTMLNAMLKHQTPWHENYANHS